MINPFTIVYGIAAVLGVLLMFGVVTSGQFLNGGTVLFAIGFLLFVISGRAIRKRVT